MKAGWGPLLAEVFAHILGEKPREARGPVRYGGPEPDLVHAWAPALTEFPDEPNTACNLSPYPTHGARITAHAVHVTCPQCIEQLRFELQTGEA